MMETIKSFIRTIPDFPKPGIQFRDITTLLSNSQGFRLTVDLLYDLFKEERIDKIVAIEARGFTIGGPLAYKLDCGLVLARKKGKLPGRVERISYELEYGTDSVEIHDGLIEPGDRCLVVDDLIATGGTARATCELIERMKGKVLGCGFIVNLSDLGGVEKLKPFRCQWLVEFEGE